MDDKEFASVIKKSLEAGINIKKIAEIHCTSITHINRVIKNSEINRKAALERARRAKQRDKSAQRRLEAASDRDKHIKARQRREKIEADKKLRDALRGVTDPKIRYEITYGIALAAFERSQAYIGKRPYPSNTRHVRFE